MDAPIIFLGHTLFADLKNLVTSLAFAKHTHEARQIKFLVLAAKADPGHLHGKIVLVDRRRVGPAANGETDTKTVGTFEVIDQLRTGVR